MASEEASRQMILDTALRLAETRHWESLRLYEVAEAAGLGLNRIRVYYREKEDLVDAWFDRADEAMLAETEKPDFLSQSTRQRLHRLIMAWLNALGQHRRVTREMIINKLEPGHLHIQIPAVMRISRTVQWMREAAQRKQTFFCRALEETALTGIYLTTFTTWLWDSSRDAMKTRRLLERLLLGAERFAGLTPCRTPENAAARRRSAANDSVVSMEIKQTPPL
jgi:AcrR family transcriptional regulator